MTKKDRQLENVKADVLDKLKATFGDRRGMLASMLVQLSLSGQPCDITFVDRSPILEVTIDPNINIAWVYGAGIKKLQEVLQDIPLSNGETIGFDKVWTIHPMPVDGISPAELSAVDLTEGEQKFGPNGETIREMIRQVYHCRSRKEEDTFLRRYLAS